MRHMFPLATEEETEWLRKRVQSTKTSQQNVQ